MIRDIPIIRARHLHNRIVARTQNPLRYILLQDNAPVGPWPSHFIRRRVADAVVFAAGVVDGVGHVEDALAVVHEDAFAEVCGAGGFAEGAGLDGGHVVGELGVEWLSASRVAPEDVVFSCRGVLECG